MTDEEMSEIADLILDYLDENDIPYSSINIDNTLEGEASLTIYE